MEEYGNTHMYGIILKADLREFKLYKLNLIERKWDVLGSLFSLFNNTVLTAGNISVDLKNLIFLSLASIQDNKYKLGINLSELLKIIDNNGILAKKDRIYFVYFNDNEVYDVTSFYENRENQLLFDSLALVKEIRGRITQLTIHDFFEKYVEAKSSSLENLLNNQLRVEKIGSVTLKYFVKKPFSPFVTKYKRAFYIGMWSEPFVLRNKYHYPSVPFCFQIYSSSVSDSPVIVPSIAHPHVNGSSMFGWYCGGTIVSSKINIEVNEIEKIFSSDIDIKKKSALIAHHLSNMLKIVNDSLVSGAEADSGYIGKSDIDEMINEGDYQIVPEVR